MGFHSCLISLHIFVAVSLSLFFFSIDLFHHSFLVVLNHSAPSLSPPLSPSPHPILHLIFPLSLCLSLMLPLLIPLPISPSHPPLGSPCIPTSSSSFPALSSLCWASRSTLPSALDSRRLSSPLSSTLLSTQLSAQLSSPPPAASIFFLLYSSLLCSSLLFSALLCSSLLFCFVLFSFLLLLLHVFFLSLPLSSLPPSFKDQELPSSEIREVPFPAVSSCLPIPS